VAVRTGTRITLPIQGFDVAGNLVTDLPVTWSVDTPVATRSADGRVEGLTPGAGTLHVTQGGLSASLPLEVIEATDRIIERIAGGGLTWSEAGPATQLSVSYPEGIVTTSAGDVLVAEGGASVIRQLTGKLLTTLTLSFPRIPATTLSKPVGLGLLMDGDLVVSDYDQHVLYRINPRTNEADLLAGAPGEAGLLDGKGATARFQNPADLAVGPDGRIAVADEYNHVIRVVERDGAVRTLAGTGEPGFVDGPGPDAAFNRPYDVAWGPDSTLYVADQYNHAVRKISPDGRVTTLVGTPETGGAPEVAAGGLSWPAGLLVDPDGDLWVSDYETGTVHVLDPMARTFRTVKTWTVLRDGTQAFLAQRKLSGPNQLAMDAGGVLYVTEYSSGHVTRLR
jgi:DNA-binding beta-propeller fold protein YncE